MSSDDLTQLDADEIKRRLSALEAEQARRRNEQHLTAVAERCTNNKRIADRAKEVLEIFQPKHQRTTCSDKIINYDCKNCIRCVLLRAVRDSYIDEEILIELTARDEPVRPL